MAAGILACRRGRHLAARKCRLQGGTIKIYRGTSGGDAAPPGWKPRLYVSQDGRRYEFQTGSLEFGVLSDFGLRISELAGEEPPENSEEPIMNPNCLYLDISQSSLKLLNGNERFEYPLDRLQNGRITEACKEELKARVQAFLKRKNWQPRLEALCAIGARGVSLRRLTLPVSTKEEFRRLLRLQIESEFPLPPEQLAWGYQSLRQNGSRQQEVLVVAVKKELIADYSELLSACGLNPAFTVAAIARSALCPQPPHSYTLLEIGRSHSELLLFENGAPASIRILPWGDGTISHSIEETPGISHDAADAGLAALAGCLDPKGLGQTLYLSGNSVRQGDFAARLSKVLGNGVRCEILDVPEQSLSSAIAGLKKSNETGGGQAPLTLQFDETKGTASGARPAPVKWAALAAAFAVLLLFMPYGEALLLKPRLAKKLAEVHAQTNRLATIERELNFLQDLKKAQSPYLDTVYLVANSTPPGTRFDTFAMNRRGEVSLKGNMQNAQQVTDFRAKLIASGFFSSVVVDEQAPGTDRQKVAVRITAQWKPAAARKPIVIDPDPAKTEKPKTGEKENKSNAPPATTTAPPTNTALPAKEPKK